MNKLQKKAQSKEANSTESKESPVSLMYLVLLKVEQYRLTR
ncbi:hypothetical protein JCM19236_6312 [Vibrio sp. JCM 19236]|nr:hypothetical protein JCM19236_6312 [Vibrio sp. JCM 19236]